MDRQAEWVRKAQAAAQAASQRVVSEADRGASWLHDWLTRHKMPPIKLALSIAVGCLSFGIVTLWFWYRGPGLHRIAGLVAIVAAGLFAGFAAEFRWPRWSKAWRIVGLATGLIMAGWTFSCAVDVESYTDRHEQVQREYSAFWHVPKYETRIDGKNHEAGPLSSSGERHGRWTMHVAGFDRVTWYWYGQRVNEGEWNRRNR